MRRKNPWDHTTRDEINYLKSIGSFRISRNGDSLRLLNNYRNSALDRVEWGDIKKQVVLDFVDKRIKELK